MTADIVVSAQNGVPALLVLILVVLAIIWLIRHI